MLDLAYFIHRGNKSSVAPRRHGGQLELLFSALLLQQAVCFVPQELTTEGGGNQDKNVHS